MQTVASQNKIYLVAGSIPTRDTQTNKLYNTSFTCDPQGAVIAKHDKMHLFDINVEGGISFQESKTLTAGSQFTTFDMVPFGIKVGVGICFDVRFHQMATIYQQMGCQLLVYPGAFNMTTGPAHWYKEYVTLFTL